MISLSSLIKTVLVNPNRSMLLAIWRICLREWVRALPAWDRRFAMGIASTSMACMVDTPVKGADGEFAAEGLWTGERKIRAPQIEALVGRVWRKSLILFRLTPPGSAGNAIIYQQPSAAPKNWGRNQVGSFLRKPL